MSECEDLLGYDWPVWSVDKAAPTVLTLQGHNIQEVLSMVNVQLKTLMKLCSKQTADISILQDREERSQETIKLMNLKILELQNTKNTQNPVYLDQLESNIATALSRTADLETMCDSQCKQSEGEIMKLCAAVDSQKNEIQRLRMKLEEFTKLSNESNHSSLEWREVMNSEVTAMKDTVAKNDMKLEEVRSLATDMSSQVGMSISQSMEFSAGFGDAIMHYLGPVEDLTLSDKSIYHTIDERGEVNAITKVDSVCAPAVDIEEKCPRTTSDVIDWSVSHEYSPNGEQQQLLQESEIRDGQNVRGEFNDGEATGVRELNLLGSHEGSIADGPIVTRPSASPDKTAVEKIQSVLSQSSSTDGTVRPCRAVLQKGMSFDYEKGYGAAIMRMVSTGMSVTVPGVGTSACVRDTEKEEKDIQKEENVAVGKDGPDDEEINDDVSTLPPSPKQQQDQQQQQQQDQQQQDQPHHDQQQNKPKEEPQVVLEQLEGNIVPSDDDSDRLEKLVVHLHERIDILNQEVHHNHVNIQESIREMKHKWNKKYVAMSESVKRNGENSLVRTQSAQEAGIQDCTLKIYQCAKCFRESVGVESSRKSTNSRGQSRSVIELPSIENKRVGPNFRLETSTSVEEGVWWNFSR